MCNRMDAGTPSCFFLAQKKNVRPSPQSAKESSKELRNTMAYPFLWSLISSSFGGWGGGGGGGFLPINSLTLAPRFESLCLGCTPVQHSGSSIQAAESSTEAVTWGTKHPGEETDKKTTAAKDYTPRVV